MNNFEKGFGDRMSSIEFELVDPEDEQETNWDQDQIEEPEEKESK